MVFSLMGSPLDRLPGNSHLLRSVNRLLKNLKIFPTIAKSSSSRDDDARK